jgi:hypothetical protein
MKWIFTITLEFRVKSLYQAPVQMDKDLAWYTLRVGSFLLDEVVRCWNAILCGLMPPV